MTIEINSLIEYNKAIGDETDLVVIDYYGKWCPPCKIIAPKFALLQSNYNNVKLYKFDVDNGLNEILNSNKITSMPTFIYYKKGIEIDRIVGADLAKIIEKIEKNR